MPWLLPLLFGIGIGGVQFCVLLGHTQDVPIILGTSGLSATLFFTGWLCGRFDPVRTNNVSSSSKDREE